MSQIRPKVDFATVVEQIVAAKARAALLDRHVTDVPPRHLLADVRNAASGEVVDLCFPQEAELEGTKKAVAATLDCGKSQFGGAVTLQLWYLPTFRASPSNPDKTGWVLLDSQQVWEDLLAELPWSDKTRLSRLVSFIVERLPTEDAKARQEALHFSWELAANKNSHSSFSPDLFSGLLSAMKLTEKPESQATCLLSLVTVWSLSVSAGIRRQLITLGAVERLLVLLEQLASTPCVVTNLSENDHKRLRRCVIGCFSVFLCDAQARARMYSPDSEELGVAVTGATGWAMLVRYAQMPDLSSNWSVRTSQELAAESLCTVLWRDHLAKTIFLRTGGLGHLRALLKSDSFRVQRCALNALCKYTGTESTRAMLMTRGPSELRELFLALLVALQTVSKQQREDETEELFCALAESASAALWGTAKALMDLMLKFEASDLVFFISTLHAVRSRFTQTAAPYFAATTAALLASDPISACTLTASNIQVCLGTIACGRDERAAAAAVAAMTLIAEHEVRRRDSGRAFRGQLDGPHRLHLIRNGVVELLIAAAASHAGSRPLCKAAAAGLMYLAGMGREESERELSGTVRLVASPFPRTSLYATCALWAFARNLNNRSKIGKLNGIQVLIDAARLILDDMRLKTPTNPYPIKHLEFILAAIWLLLTFNGNRRYLERAAVVSPPEKEVPTSPEPTDLNSTAQVQSNTEPSVQLSNLSPASRRRSIGNGEISNLKDRAVPNRKLDNLKQQAKQVPRRKASSHSPNAAPEKEVQTRFKPTGLNSPSQVQSNTETPVQMPGLSPASARRRSIGNGEIPKLKDSALQNTNLTQSDLSPASRRRSIGNGEISKLKDRVAQTRKPDNLKQQEKPSLLQNASLRNRNARVSLSSRGSLRQRVGPSTAVDEPSSGNSGQANARLHASPSSKPLQTNHHLQTKPNAKEILDSPAKLPKVPGVATLTGLGAEVKGLEFLMGMIAGEGSLEGPAWDASKLLAVNAVIVATQSLLEYEKKVIDLGIVPALSKIAKDPEASEGLRKASAKFCQSLSGLVSNAPDLGLQQKESVLEVLVHLLRSGKELLEARGARGCAHVAMYPEHKARLAALGAIEALIDLAKKTRSQEVMGLVMAALLNLSTSAAYQESICKVGLYVILSVNRSKTSSEDVRRLSTGVLLNICRHAGNRTRMYKAELRLKSLDVETRSPSKSSRASRLPGCHSPVSTSKLPRGRMRRCVSVLSFETKSFPKSPTDRGHSDVKQTKRLRDNLAKSPASTAAYPNMRRALSFEQTTSVEKHAESPLYLEPTFENDENLSSNEEFSDDDAPELRFIGWMRSTWHDKKPPRSPSRKAGNDDMEEFEARFGRAESDDSNNVYVAAPERRRATTYPLSLDEPPSPAASRPRRATAPVGSGVELGFSPRKKATTNLGSLEEVPKTNVLSIHVPKTNALSSLVSPVKATGRESPVRQLTQLQKSLRRPVSEMWVGDRTDRSPPPPSPCGERTKARGYTRHGWSPEIGGYDLKGEEGPNSPARSAARSPKSSRAKQLTVIVDPDRPRNRVRFGDLYTEHNPSVEHLDMFAHVDGCNFCKQLYAHYKLPNGELAHFFQHGKRLVDEVEVPLERPADPPVTFEDCLQTGLPGPVPILRGLCDIPPDALPKPYAPAPCLAPKPSRHVLHVVDHECPNKDPGQCPRHGELAAANPLFVLVSTEEPRTSTETGENKGLAVSNFEVKQSIFAKRKKECDAKSYFHHSRLEDKMFDLDWTRVAKKTRFIKTLGTAEDVAALKEVLKNNFMNIMHVFDYFGTIGTGEPYAMTLKEFNQFLTQSKIPDENSAACKLTDCERVFISSNYEYDKNSLESEINDDNSLCRFEFIETLIRLAVAKYGNLAHIKNTPEAVVELLQTDVFPNSPVELDVDLNAFRSTQLYCSDVDAVFSAYEPFLRAVFNYYKGIRAVAANENPGRYMELPHWLDLIADVRLTEAEHGAPATKAIFVYGRMLVADELLDHARAISCTFIDFLEMLARLAAQKKFPSEAELERRGFVGEPKLHAYLLSAHRSDNESAVRSSNRTSLREARPSDERSTESLENESPSEIEDESPLYERLTQLLDLIAHRLKHLHSAKDAEHLRKKLLAAVKV